MIKTCPRCHQVKPAEAFGIDRTTADKRTVYCRSCKAVLNAEFYAKNRERINARDRDRYQSRKAHQVEQQS